MSTSTFKLILQIFWRVIILSLLVGWGMISWTAVNLPFEHSDFGEHLGASALFIFYGLLGFIILVKQAYDQLTVIIDNSKVVWEEFKTKALNEKTEKP